MKQINAIEQYDDPAEYLWRAGVVLLTRAGLAESTARQFLGGAVKKFGKTKVAEKVAVLSAIPAVPDPRAWLVAACNGATRKPTTDEEWLDLGRERGVSPRPGEEWARFRKRVQEAAP